VAVGTARLSLALGLYPHFVLVGNMPPIIFLWVGWLTCQLSTIHVNFCCHAVICYGLGFVNFFWLDLRQDWQ
jgi:hypothetical protein